MGGSRRSGTSKKVRPAPSEDQATQPPLRGVVIMPMPWRGGMLKVAVRLSNLLARHAYRGRKLQMCLAAAQGVSAEGFDLDPNVSFVPIGLEPVFAADPRLSRYLDPALFPFAPQEPERFVAPTSPNVALYSADFWISLTGFYNEGPLAPFKPYAVFAPDFIQRYVPEIFPPDITNYGWYREVCQILTLQGAKVVFATTPKTASDVTAHAGVALDRVMLFPLFNSHAPGRFKPRPSPRIEADARGGRRGVSGYEHEAAMKQVLQYDHVYSPEFQERPYFVWVTNTTQHKNHLRALEMLANYYERHGGELNCLIIGPTTNRWAETDTDIPYINAVAEGIKALSARTRSVALLGELPSNLYAQVLSGARFLWHNVLYDNGTFSILEAAEGGGPEPVQRLPPDAPHL